MKKPYAHIPSLAGINRRSLFGKQFDKIERNIYTSYPEFPMGPKKKAELEYAGEVQPSEHLLRSLSSPRQTECAQMATRVKSAMLFHSLSASCSRRMVLVSTTCSCSHMWATAALVEPVCRTQIHHHAPGLCSLLGHHHIPQPPPPSVPRTSY